MIQRNGGRGRDGEQKKFVLLSATPINNDLLNDLSNQIRLFTQSQPDYFREAGIGDFNAYLIGGFLVAASNRSELPQDVSAFFRMVAAKGRRKNNCRRTDVEHVFNLLGTMESCPTYFCAGPNKSTSSSVPMSFRKGKTSKTAARSSTSISLGTPSDWSKETDASTASEVRTPKSASTTAFKRVRNRPGRPVPSRRLSRISSLIESSTNPSLGFPARGICALPKSIGCNWCCGTVGTLGTVSPRRSRAGAVADLLVDAPPENLRAFVAAALARFVINSSHALVTSSAGGAGSLARRSARPIRAASCGPFAGGRAESGSAAR